MITKSDCGMLSVVLLVGVLLAACQPAPPPFECTDAIGCEERIESEHGGANGIRNL